MSPTDPFRVNEVQPGNFSLVLDQDGLFAVIDVFRNLGHEGNGYAWASIAQHLLEAQPADLADDIEHDPEASSYAAYSSDRAALERLGMVLAAVYRDGERLGALITELGSRLDD